MQFTLLMDREFIVWKLNLFWSYNLTHVSFLNNKINSSGASPLEIFREEKFSAVYSLR